MGITRSCFGLRKENKSLLDLARERDTVTGISVSATSMILMSPNRAKTDPRMKQDSSVEDSRVSIANNIPFDLPFIIVIVIGRQ